MAVLKDFTIRLPDSKNRDFPVIAAKIALPEGAELSWGTTIRFEDGIQAFITVDRRFLEIVNGYTIEECYSQYTGKSLSFLEKHRRAEFNVYAYRTIIDGCSVGTRLTFRDVEDGQIKDLCTYWNYSLQVMNSERLINEAAAAEGGMITTDYCSEVFRVRGNLHGILEQVISRVLLETEFSRIHSRIADISEEVKKEFISRGGYTATGFTLQAFTLGNIELAQD